MHRVFHGLRPAFGIGRDFMGSDGVQKAAALIGGINDRSDDIVDPFLGAEFQPVNPIVRAPLPKSHLHQRVQPQPFSAHIQQQQQQQPFRVKEPVQQSHHLGFRSQQVAPVNQHTHTPTPISTLLAFKKQIKTDATSAPDLSLPLLPLCAIPQTVLPPITAPEYPATTYPFLEGDFDLAQELEALESMKLESVNNELDAAMDFWGTAPEDTIKTELMDMQTFSGVEDMGSIAPQDIFWSEDMGTMSAITIPQDPQPMPLVPAVTLPPAPPPAATAAAPAPVVRNTRANPYVHKACVHCKASHVACNNARPCQRCVRSGKADTCVDSERKKRGRPGSSATTLSTCGATEHHETSALSSSSRPKKRSKPSPRSSLAQSVSPTCTPTTSTAEDFTAAQLFALPAADGPTTSDMELEQAVAALQSLMPLNLAQAPDLFADQTFLQQQINDTQALEAAVVATAQAMVAGLQQAQPSFGDSPANLWAMEDAANQFPFAYTPNNLM